MGNPPLSTMSAQSNHYTVPHQCPPPTMIPTPPPPPPPSHLAIVSPGGEVSLAARAAGIAHKLDLEDAMVEDLLRWAGTEVIVVADDSGSMQSVSCMKQRTSRWEELQLRLAQLLDILLLVDDGSGFELKFLNSGSAVMIKSHADLKACWQWAKPSGRTPLGGVLRDYLRPSTLEQDRLLLVMTDGSPSDVTFEQLGAMIRGKSEGVFVSFIMCTEEDDVVDAYNKKVDPLPGVDVMDDYASEQKEAEAMGNQLSLNKYLVKSVLGPKFPKYDKLDEVRGKVSSSCQCAIM